MRFIQSIRWSVRTLRFAPGFALTATLTLALGIGLSTAVFTVANALLLRKLPVRDQEQLVVLWGEKRDGSFGNFPLGITEIREFTRTTRALRDVAYFDYNGAWPAPIVGADNVTRLRRAFVSGNFFDVLGVRAVLGRTLRPSDDVLGAAPVVVLSYNAWQRQFGGNPHAVGARIVLQESGTAYTIVGVIPPALEYPAGAEFWAPFTPGRLRTPKDSAYADVDLLGRLAPGATPTSAKAELTSFFTRPASSVWQRDVRGVVYTLPSVILGDARPAVLVFSAAAALLLLITCINVANLLLVRGLARVREVAIRAALGAGRSQIVAGLLAENALLALGGGVLGVGVAAAAVRGFVIFAPASVPLLSTVRLDAASLAAAIAIAGLAMLLFGLAPAVVASGANLQDALRSGTRQSAGRRSRLAREALVSAQVALGVLVLSAAALVGRSLMKLENADLQFDASHLLIAELGLRYDRYDSVDKQLPLMRALVMRLRATPGIRAVSPVVAVPFSGSGGWDGRAGVEGQSPADAAKNPMFNMEVVTPDYFETFGLRVLRGRAFTDADRKGSEPVVMISETTARHYFPNANPIGKRLFLGGKLDIALTVIGIVPDTRYRELREARASVYFPLAQSFFPFAPTTLALRTTGASGAILPTIRRVIGETAPGVVLVGGAPFETYMRGPLGQPRLNAFLLAVFAVAATALAAIGLFGVTATLVRQRTRELGVRMALGATARDIRSLVVGRGLGIVGVGVVLGLAAALVVNRVLSSLLYAVSPTDAVSLALVGLLMIAVTLVATFIPARASARIDPVIALRTEG